MKNYPAKQAVRPPQNLLRQEMFLIDPLQGRFAQKPVVFRRRLASARLSLPGRAGEPLLWISCSCFTD